MTETYLGDGLFASFDGWQLKLRAPRENFDHEVYLEPSTYVALQKFAGDCFVDSSKRGAFSPHERVAEPK